jgi:uncharacterized protein (DUF305 family)
MKPTVFALLTFTALASPALAQSPTAPLPDQSQAAPAVPATPPAQTSPQPQQGAMMCGMMAAGQQGQGQQGGCGCCRGMSGMMGNQPQRQGAMPMDHSRMAQTQHGQDQHSMASGSSASEHAGHGAMNAAQTSDTPATQDLREANARMHRAMAIRYTNDIDVDFARSMIPHHQGALEMAKVALAHAKEPETRKLAEEIVKAQEVEIARMRAFLKRKGAE